MKLGYAVDASLGNGIMRAVLLLIEDNDDLAFGLRMNLEIEGFDVLCAGDGAEGLRLFRDSNPDLIVLDLRLPDMSGFDVLKNVRATGCATPVVIVSALGDEPNKVLGFRLGADDYIVKPFSLGELIERIKARIRTNRIAPAMMRCGGLQIDRARRVATVEGTRLDLTSKEFDLLVFLAMNVGVPKSQDEILTEVWHIDGAAKIRTRTVEQHVRQVRKKLGRHDSGICIRTLPRQGFVFELNAIIQ